MIRFYKSFIKSQVLTIVSVVFLPIISFAQDGMSVGTNATPDEMLDVNGAIKIGMDFTGGTGAPLGGRGTIRWNNAQTRFEGWNGGSWVLLSSAGTDNQDLGTAALSGASLLSIAIEDGATTSVSLAALEESADISAVASDLADHETADGDLDDSNEIQVLGVSGSTLSLTNGGGSITLPSDGDGDATNEIQNLGNSVSGTDRTITITGGTPTTISVADNDNSATNEIQDLTLSGNTLALSGSSPASVDLSTFNNSGTDNQDLGTAALSGASLLSIAIEDGAATSVSLAALEESADISAVASDLADHETADGDLDNSNEIQDLSIASNVLTLSGDATTVSLVPYLDNTDSQTAAQVAVTPTGNLAADDVQEALVELQVDIDNIAPTIEDVLDNGNLAADGQLLRIDQVRAIDVDGLLLTDEADNGIFIEDGGNVGIGTLAPTFLLDVAGEGVNQGPITISDNVLARFEQSEVAKGGGIQVKGYRGSANNLSSFVDLMNYGNPNTDYTVARLGAERGADATQAGSLLLYTNSGSALTERMRINSAGTVNVNSLSGSGGNRFVLVDDLGNLSYSAAAPPATVGTVTNFSAGDLSPLFTTTEATTTSTPALSFTAVNQTANRVFAGPTTGSAAAPTFRALVAADIPAGSTSYIQNQTSIAQPTSNFWVSGTGSISGGQPLIFTSIGSGIYDKTVVYHNTTKLMFDLAKTTDAVGGTPIDFDIDARGGGHNFFHIEGSNGNVGIGTPTPTQSKLVVNGSVSLPRGEMFQFLESISGTFRAGIASTNTLDPGVGQNSLRFMVNASTTPAMVIGGSINTGNVGFGTTDPTIIIDTKVNQIIGSSASNGTQHATSNRGTKVSFGSTSGVFTGMRILVGAGTAACGNTGDIRFDTWECNTSPSREVMRITGGGEVGIGTASPRAKLHVEGNIVSPAWPAFNVYNSSGGNQSTTGTFNATNEVFDNGNNFNLSTDEFTAPIYGIYQFNWTCLSNSAGGRVFLYVNGTSRIQTESNAKSLAITLSLSSGDKVKLGGNSPSYPMTWYGSSGHNAFSGHLVMGL
jgi:hypothetical protein